LLDFDGFGDGTDNIFYVDEVLDIKEFAFVGLEPFRKRLMAADVVVPGRLRDAMDAFELIEAENTVNISRSYSPRILPKSPILLTMGNAEL